jgi:hypothetical protein
MVNRTALAALLLALTSPSWGAGEAALQQAKALNNGGAANWDGAITQPRGCEGEACRINSAVEGALAKGGLVVTEARSARPIMSAEVPAPTLGKDAEGSKDKPGFFSKLFSGKGLMYGLGGAAAGAGVGFLLGGPVGALIGGLLGAVGGFFLSKMLAK